MAIQNLGNSKGFIYITDNNNNILSNIANNDNGKKSVIKDALTNSSLASNSTSLTEGKRYYLNTGGAEGSITGATEITSYITNVGGNNKMPSSSVSLSSRVLTYTRTGSIQKIVLDTEGAQATSDCLYIRETNSVISDGDILIVVGASMERVSTMWDSGTGSAYTKNLNATPSGVGMMYLDTQKEWATGTDIRDDGSGVDAYTIMIMYNATSTCWYEINRVPVNTDILLGNIITVDKLKASGVNIKKEGVERITSISGGDAFTPIEDSTAGIIEVSGTHNLSAGTYTINVPSGGNARTGDEYVVRWSANITTSGAVNVFGKTLVSEDYSQGATAPFEIKTRYINGAWTTINPITKDAAAMERTLKNPTTDGMVLTSTAAGVRTWSTTGGMRYKKYTYDFAVLTGAVGTYSLGTDATELLPNKAIVDAESSYIQVATALTSGGLATVEVGILPASTSGAYQATDTDFFNGATAFSAAPFNGVGDVVKGDGNLGQLLTSAKVTFKINVAALTGGKVNVYVAYIEAA